MNMKETILDNVQDKQYSQYEGRTQIAKESNYMECAGQTRMCSTQGTLVRIK